MKRIGLLGGMSWESSIEYYRFVNEEVRERLGGLHSVSSGVWRGRPATLDSACGWLR